MTHRQLYAGAVLAASLALCACSDRDAATAPAPAQTQDVPAAAAPAGQTVGGDGSAITLGALELADLESNPLVGELGCSFSTDQASPLIVAMGYVASAEAAQGLVKVAGSVERIATPGGFDAMVKGPVFTGQGKTIRITLTGQPTGGGESPPVPATLTYQRADGASLTLDGRWVCGP